MLSAQSGVLLWEIFSSRNSSKEEPFSYNELQLSLYLQRKNLSGITNFNSDGNYLFKVNNRNTKTRSEICSKLAIKTPERRLWLRSGVFTVNFEQVNAS